jgi:DNA-directed RNA polymerase specialized sigma subunit
VAQPQSEHFLQFVKSLKALIPEYDGDDERRSAQEAQVNGLVQAERDFRSALIRHPHGDDVYRAFVRHIMVEKRNLLMARPYFRERDKTFKARIAHVLRRAADLKKGAEHHRRLYRFDINYQFVRFAMDCRKWANDQQSKKLMRLARDVLARREEIIQCNLPLAISRARLFFARNRSSHMTYMDMVQVASGGLAAGVDKFVGPYGRSFVAVLIGRILGDLIEANSETFVHFFPPDKRRLYRIRKIVTNLREGIADADYAVILKALNREEKEKGDLLTKFDELHHLVSASMLVNASTLPVTIEDEEHGSPIERYPDDAENRPDSLMEEVESVSAVALAISKLPLLDQKLLRLRGVDMTLHC